MTEIQDWHNYPWNYSDGTKSVNGFGDFIDYTAFVTNNAGILLIIIWSLLFLFFGMWLLSKGR